MAAQDYCHDDENGLEQKNGSLQATHPKQKSDPFPYPVRSTLAQCFATFVVSLSLISVGILYTVPTIVIASVKADAKNNDGELFLSSEQISWYASFLPIFQPCGCFFGGWLQNYVGRRQGLLLMNASNVLAWVLLYQATNVEMLYTSSSLMGISMGLTEAPSVTYVSEIATPSLRGTLITYNSANVVLGSMLTFLLSVFMGWRTLSLVCILFSIFSVLLLLTIPDSPVWLMSRERTEDAIKALKWLRGWVPETRYVLPEFKELNRFMNKSFSDNSKEEHDNDNSQNNNRTFKASYLLEAGTLRPFVLLFCMMSFAYSASTQAARNYYLVIIDSLNIPIDGNLLALLNGAASLVGSVTCAATVKLLGKRVLNLWSMILCSVCTLLLGLYIKFESELQLPYVFIVLFIVLGFLSCVGISTMPWVMFGEIYPAKTKSVAVGITGAAYYVSFSIYVKTYYYLQLLLATHGTFILYGIVGFVGFFYLWIMMPETEGKTMAEIEELFEDNARKCCTHFRKKK